MIIKENSNILKRKNSNILIIFVNYSDKNMKKESTKSLDNNFKLSESKFKLSFFDELENKQFKSWNPFDPNSIQN